VSRPIDGLVLLAPTLSWPSGCGCACRPCRPCRDDVGLAERVERGARAARGAAPIRPLPVTIVHGLEDDVSPPLDSRRLADAMPCDGPHRGAHYVEGRGHWDLVSDPAALAPIAALLARLVRPAQV